MQDVTGREILIDDRIVFIHHRCKELRVGTVIGFSEKMVRIAFRDKNTPLNIHNESSYAPHNMAVIKDV